MENLNIFIFSMQQIHWGNLFMIETYCDLCMDVSLAKPN